MPSRRFRQWLRSDGSPGLSASEPPPGSAAVLARLLLLVREVRREEVRLRRDRRERVRVRDAGDEHERGRRDRPPAARGDREHDEAAGERDERRAREREEEPGRAERDQRRRRAAGGAATGSATPDRSSATTSMNAVASGLMKLETSRRNSPSAVLNAKLSGRPPGPW